METRAVRPVEMTVGWLPVEILSIIFLWAAILDSDNDYAEPWHYVDHARTQWFSLTQVCKHWREVALDTSELWTHIDVGRSIEWLELGLSRSRNRTIDVGLHSLRTAKRAIRLLSAHVHRLHKLSIHWVPRDAATSETVKALINKICRMELPALVELCVHLGKQMLTDGHNARLVALRPACFPSLQTVRFRWAYLPWDSALFSQLEVLHLEEVAVPWEEKLPLDIFLAAIERCVSLEELTLSFALPVQFPHEDNLPGSDRVVVLPRLRHVHIEWDSVWTNPPEIFQFLEHFQLPPKASLTIVVEYSVEACCLNSDCEAALELIPDNLPILNKATSLYLECTPPTGPDTGEAYYLVETDDDVYLGFTLKNDSARCKDGKTWTFDVDVQLAGFCALFEDSPHLTRLTIDTEEYTAEGLETAFSRLPEITIIEATYTSLDALRELLAALATPLEPDSPDGPPVMPKLRSLKIKELPWDPELLPAIEECLEWRAKRGTELSQLQLEVYGRPTDEDGDIDFEMAQTTQIVSLQMQMNGSVVLLDVPKPVEGTS
ncbi:hypothetical protein OH77DRAFT_964185 [Trametes cingulata]|nr:hypothetical protein OH77DRAFT_964185 [Trametes cingulata]